VTKLRVKEEVCDKVVCERVVCERVVCERVVCERIVCGKVACERLVCDRVICERVARRGEEETKAEERTGTHSRKTRTPRNDVENRRFAAELRP